MKIIKIEAAKRRKCPRCGTPYQKHPDQLGHEGIMQCPKCFLDYSPHAQSGQSADFDPATNRFRMGPTEQIFPGAMTKYLLLNYRGEDLVSARRFSSIHDDLDVDPYGGNVGFSIGSNEQIIKEEDAPIWIIRMAENDASEKKDWSGLLQEIRRKSNERVTTKASVKTAKTRFEAEVAWANHSDVMCPGCENHVHEDEAEEYMGDIWHDVCVREDIRINRAADLAEAERYDPQEELPSDKFASNECGGFRPAKGHLDTQMFPECKGWPTDRDIVKKNRKGKKGKRVHKADHPIDDFDIVVKS